MHARSSVLFALVTVAFVTGCEAQKAEMPEARFAVGSVPYYTRRGLAEGPACITEFNRGAENGQPLAAPGRFTGTCNGFTHTFEAVRVDRITFSQSGGLEGMTLDHTHPEATMWLQAMPQDAAGALLEHGERQYGVWTPGPGCEGVVRLATLRGESGNEQPADSMQITAVAAGTCVIAVEYLGAHASAKVTVR